MDIYIPISTFFALHFSLKFMFWLIFSIEIFIVYISFSFFSPTKTLNNLLSSYLIFTFLITNFISKILVLLFIVIFDSYQKCEKRDKNHSISNNNIRKDIIKIEDINKSVGVIRSANKFCIESK